MVGHCGCCIDKRIWRSFVIAALLINGFNDLKQALGLSGTVLTQLPATAVAEHLAHKICALDVARLPEAVRAKCEDLLVDVVGLAVTARNEDYVKAALAGCDDDGPCTAIGHGRTLSAAAAALVNGTVIHGEDFDDTFQGGPIYAGAVIVPVVLAACERHAS